MKIVIGLSFVVSGALVLLFGQDYVETKRGDDLRIHRLLIFFMMVEGSLLISGLIVFPVICSVIDSCDAAEILHALYGLVN